MKKKINFFDVFYFIFIAAMIWMSVTSTIQAFKDPKLTRTELFILIPHSYMLDFKTPSKN